MVPSLHRQRVRSPLTRALLVAKAFSRGHLGPCSFRPWCPCPCSSSLSLHAASSLAFCCASHWTLMSLSEEKLTPLAAKSKTRAFAVGSSPWGTWASQDAAPQSAVAAALGAHMGAQALAALEATA